MVCPNLKSEVQEKERERDLDPWRLHLPKIHSVQNAKCLSLRLSASKGKENIVQRRDKIKDDGKRLLKVFKPEISMLKIFLVGIGLGPKV